MRLGFDQLSGHLSRGLKPIYVICGDEPLQMGEATDQIRRQARQDGFLAREVLEVDQHFDWERLRESANSLSLFSEQRVIDLRIPSGKPGSAGGKALTEYAERPAEDTLLLVTLPKLERGQINSRWLRSLDSVGAFVQIWPINPQHLPNWVKRRMECAGLSPEPGVVAMLVERIEGNLLAARQEIEKMLLLFGPGKITQEQLSNSVADSARFDVFALVDSALEGRAARCLRILNGVRAEGTPAPVVLWALARELRLLAGLAGELTRDRPASHVVAASRVVWDKRKPLVTKGLQRLDAGEWRRLLRRCPGIDRAIKGQSRADPWLLIEALVLNMAGVNSQP